MAGKLDLPQFKRLFAAVYSQLEGEGFFQEFFGYDCVDAGLVPGKLGNDVESAMLLVLGNDRLWPVSTEMPKYSEDDMFDMLEFLHDHCSKPTKSTYHSWSECGLHCSEFDGPAGQAIFRDRIAPILVRYRDGYELNREGEILELADSGLEALFEAPIPTEHAANVEARIESAKRKFRRFRATLDERRDAVRDLADVLEFLRPQLKKSLTAKDEADLFHIANSFGIRHHNEAQKQGYDKAIFYSWLFYYYLAALHASLRLIQRESSARQ